MQSSAFTLAPSNPFHKTLTPRKRFQNPRFDPTSLNSRKSLALAPINGFFAVPNPRSPSSSSSSCARSWISSPPVVSDCGSGDFKAQVTSVLESAGQRECSPLPSLRLLYNCAGYEMDFSDSTKAVFNRIKMLAPEHVTKIIGYLLLQDHGGREMIRLAFGPDKLIHSLISKVKDELGLTSRPELSFVVLNAGSGAL